MTIDVIAVLDVGKTNKKVIIYDLAFMCLDIASKMFEEVVSKADDMTVEQPEQVYNWFVEVLKEFASQYNIKAVSVTTHGAFGVCLDEDGNITCPPFAYTNTPGEEFCNSFYDSYGTRSELQQQTATAEIGEMVNFAKIVHYWNVNYPAEMNCTKYILMYPQYFGFKLTGNAGAEPTMLGCHTYLYDHGSNSYSDIADQLGIRGKLPESICNSWEILGTVTESVAAETGLPSDCIVTYGVHDSNSSMLPFLVTEDKDFVLNSTGTWCVVMKQANSVELSSEEIGKTVFYNQSVFKAPIKTSIFMGGLEYEKYMELLYTVHGRRDLPDLDPKLYSEIFENRDCYILPSIVKGAGMFPDLQARVIDNGKCLAFEDYSKDPSEVKFFADYEKAVAVLISSLAIQTSCALEAAGYKPGDQIFVEGGFRKNEPYLQLLSAMYSESEVFITNIEQATAMGAAILAFAALNNENPKDIDWQLEIDKKVLNNSIEIESFSKYKQGFLDLVRMESRVNSYD